MAYMVMAHIVMAPYGHDSPPPSFVSLDGRWKALAEAVIFSTGMSVCPCGRHAVGVAGIEPI